MTYVLTTIGIFIYINNKQLIFFHELRKNNSVVQPSLFPRDRPCGLRGTNDPEVPTRPSAPFTGLTPLEGNVS